jgi:hypothetical protein
MSILIDLVLGNNAAVFDHLLQIVRCDPGLTTWQPTPYVLEVTFQQKQQAVASSNRILAISNAAQNVLIIGVNGTFVSPDGSGAPISADGGGITFRGSLTEPITIYLDVTASGGAGYWVLNSQRQTMPAPLQVILYHEFAHAYHMLTGDEPPTEQGQQVQAIHDENDFRAQLSLELRNSTNDGGGVGTASHQGFPFPMCKPVYPGFNWDCIVASAAVGSAYAPLVDELRRARREYRSLSLWTSFICEPMLDLYRQFSPGVVRAMNTDPKLRQAMLLYFVRPIFHLLQITENYLRSELDDDQLPARLDPVVDEYLAEVGKMGLAAHTFVDAADGAGFAARSLGENRATPEVHSGGGDTPADLYGYLASMIAAEGRETVGYAWAFEGIKIFLRLTASRSAGGEGVTPTFLEEFGAWLARLPFPEGASLSIEDAREELKFLAERVFTRSHSRAQFAQHLLARWPAASQPALRLLLSDLQYLQPRHDDLGR